MSNKITCTHCGATNNVPEDRMHDNPSCGSCGEQIFDGKPADLDPATFEAMMANNDTPVVVDFWAPWCGPCVGMADAYSEAASQLSPDYRLVKVNTQDHPDVAAKFGIRGIPTLISFEGGKEVGRQSGAMGLDAIVSWVKQTTQKLAS